MLGSTSDLCGQRAAAGEPAGLAILAHRQTSGRGSHGRGWESLDGNLSLSILLRPGGSASNAGSWSLLAGVVLLDALASHAPAGSLQLKWPNDVLMTGRKVGGVLIETTLSVSGEVEALVIGLGANLASAPPIPGRETACLAEHGAPPRPERVAQDVLTGFDRWLDNPDAVRCAWLDRAHPIGTALRVTVGEAIVPGRFAGLSAAGYLLLEDERGQVRTIASGRLLD